MYNVQKRKNECKKVIGYSVMIINICVLLFGYWIGLKILNYAYNYDLLAMILILFILIPILII